MKKKKLKIVRAFLGKLEGKVAEELEKLQEVDGLNEIQEIIPGGIVTLGNQAIAVTYIKYEQGTAMAKEIERKKREEAEEKQRMKEVEDGLIPPWEKVVTLPWKVYDSLIGKERFCLDGEFYLMARTFPRKLVGKKVLLTKKGNLENHGILCVLEKNTALYKYPLDVYAEFSEGRETAWQKKED